LGCNENVCIKTLVSIKALLKENLKIKLRKIVAFRNLTNLQAHLKTQFIGLLEKMDWQFF